MMNQFLRVILIGVCMMSVACATVEPETESGLVQPNGDQGVSVNSDPSPEPIPVIDEATVAPTPTLVEAVDAEAESDVAESDTADTIDGAADSEENGSDQESEIMIDYTAADLNKITLERQPCFGTCPVYTVTIFADGTVQYNGKQFVAAAGLQEATIAPESVTALFDAMKEAGYFEWERMYVNQEMTDMPTVITSIVTNDDKTKQIIHYAGDSSAPDALSEIEAMIDETATVTQWVRGDVSQLSGGTWALSSEPFVDAGITAEFMDGKIVGYAGCNTYSAPYTADGNTLTISGIATTRKACEKTLMDNESQFVAAMRTVQSFRLMDGVLSLNGESSVLRFSQNSANDDANGVVQTWFVHSLRTMCKDDQAYITEILDGEREMSCLLVGEVKGDWQNFSEPIVGFEYEEGYGYEIRVRVTKSADTTQYELVEMVSKTAVATE